MSSIENQKFELELKVSGNTDYPQRLSAQLEEAARFFAALRQ